MNRFDIVLSGFAHIFNISQCASAFETGSPASALLPLVIQEGKLWRGNNGTASFRSPNIYSFRPNIRGGPFILTLEYSSGGADFVADPRVHVPGAGGGRGGNTGGRGRGDGGDDRGIGDDGEVADIDQSIDRYDYLIAFPHSREGRGRGAGGGRGHRRWGEVRRLLYQSVQKMYQSYTSLSTQHSCMQF